MAVKRLDLCFLEKILAEFFLFNELENCGKLIHRVSILETMSFD